MQLPNNPILFIHYKELIFAHLKRYRKWSVFQFLTC